jgi:transcriptional regulator with XRE-family HTH domain
MTFGERITEARRIQQLTQRAVATSLDISATYINDLEHGRRLPPSSRLIEEFATVLNIPREVLYWDAGRLPPDYCSLTQDDARIVRAYTAMRQVVLAIPENTQSGE